MDAVNWKLRLKLLLQRLWQPTCACMTLMSAPGFGLLLSGPHWLVALRTGLGTGLLAIALTFTPARRAFRHPLGNALVVGVLTAIADAWSHPGRFGHSWLEPLLTGLVAATLALVGWFAIPAIARRLGWGRRDRG